MSSVRNAVQRRNHKERSQPAARQKLGLLEKKKDYVLRAKDYHSKQNRLSAMKHKAFFKNPDEFYFAMINSKTKDGVHVVDRNERFSGDFLKLLKSQDVNYVSQLRDADKKKIEKMKANLHFMDATDETEEGQENEDEDMSDDGANASVSRSKHIVFVDDEEEVKNFKPEEYFDTLPELVGRKYNRPRTEQLQNDDGLRKLRKKDLTSMEKAREATYKELDSRLQREEKLKKLESEMRLQKNLMGKGRRKKIGKDSDGLPKFKWLEERKK